ncbi:unnamed protein product [Strongylus vulgaris]|uniref:Uncharacterized protein n=1 Tax=Strongylus vulgaris TaxID=40348 RepID=A0A3P7LAW5_STRVU|nr:unnamed protein product [Strongylus vulgaris]
MGIRNADDLFFAAQEKVTCVSLFAPIDNEELIDFGSDSDEESSSLSFRGRSRKKKRTINSRPLDRTPSSSPPPYTNCNYRSFKAKCGNSLSEQHHSLSNRILKPSAQDLCPWNCAKNLQFVASSFLPLKNECAIDAMFVVPRVVAKVLGKISIIVNCWGLLFMFSAYVGRHFLDQ